VDFSGKRKSAVSIDCSKEEKYLLVFKGTNDFPIRAELG
jgi:hypothetical protein